MVSDRIYRVAAETAAHSPMKHKLGCVIYWDDKHILASCYNRPLTLSARKCFVRRGRVHGIPVWSVHSEIAALIYALTNPSFQVRNLRNSKVYVHRIGGRLAKPCAPCYTALISSGIRPKDIEWSKPVSG